jgi:hypothetical protein
MNLVLIISAYLLKISYKANCLFFHKTVNILNNRYVKVINDEPFFSKVIKPHVLQYLNDRKYSILKYWNDSQFHLPISLDFL